MSCGGGGKYALSGLVKDMRQKRKGILFISLLALAFSLAPLSSPSSAERQFTVTVLDTEGTETVVQDFRWFVKGKDNQIFSGHRGKALVIVPFKGVKTLEVKEVTEGGDKSKKVLALVTTWDGRQETFYASGKYKGDIRIGTFFIDLSDVKKITFHPPKARGKERK